MPTVTGTFKDLSGNLLAGISVELIPTAGITVNGSNEVVLPIRKKVVTGSDGTISTSLSAGTYQFEVEGVVLAVTVPDQPGAVDLSDPGVITNQGQGGGGATY